MRLIRMSCLFAAVACAPLCLFAADGAAPSHRVVQVQLDATASTQPVSGRLLVFAVPVAAAQKDKEGKVGAVDTNVFEPKQVAVAAQEIEHMVTGTPLTVDLDMLAFPTGFAQLAAGDYYLQAVLDVDHSYNYSGRGSGDLLSDVAQAKFNPDSALPTLTLKHAVPKGDPWTAARWSKETLAAIPAARSDTDAIDFISPALSRFWGKPVAMRGWVLVPPEYNAHPERRYPTVYYTHGFSGNADSMVGVAAGVHAAMRDGRLPPMIWVLLDESSATGTHEFADSVNNGPWGEALTAELMPHLEAKYRMDGQASGRFLLGHSSGGWATLWLQTRYPKLFGGTWSTSPDPSDFHDYTGVDLYAPNANVYRASDGTLRPLMRNEGKVVASFEDFARLERVIGLYGGQMASFEWVFSPRGADGRPMPLFDRETGAVDPQVAAYWRQHYDIAERLRTQWPTLQRDLDGKIHVIVGTADTFYLDGAARRLQAVLNDLHAKADVRFLDGKHHFNLYAEGEDRDALRTKIVWEMYAIARPVAKRQDTAASRATN